ncbi:MAG: glycoside hydrolase family 2, partial [Prevotella sp.]|nr:glycoside hydrolase family 2 [Prevotella sp.]
MRRILFCCCLLLVTVSMSANAIYGEKKVRLSQGWEFVKGEWSGIDDVIASDKAANMSSTPQWMKVCLPHCYNSDDAVDPDVVYYKGIAWYRTTLSIDNPYPQGRTILEFEGAGQKVQVYVYDELVATHIGGYDAWMVDITDAVKRFKNNTASEKYQGGIPIAVRCDNRHDEEMIPSDLSDFNLYGGIYRHVNLVYLPNVGVEHIHVTPTLSNNRKRGSLTVEISLYNPLQTTGSSWSYVIKDPQGKVVGSTKDLSVTDNHGSSPALSLKGKPQLWDVNNP